MEGQPMTPDALKSLFDKQRRHRWVTKTSTAAQRAELLTQLKAEIRASIDEISAALNEDLLRTQRAAKVEVAPVLADIDDAIANLDRWMAPTEYAPIPALGDAATAVRYEARGVCLLFGPWNFPFALVFQPLVAIVAAGNTAIVKPNEMAPATSAVAARIITSVFAQEHVAVVEGGVDLAERLLDLPVDHIFFTGSPAVARKVMARAAEHLASVTLELGGKCPAIIDADADVELAATHIAAGKHQNAGQICLAPDHVWVHRDVRDEFVKKYLAAVENRYYIDGALAAERLGKLVDRRNFDRVSGYLDDAVARGAEMISVGDSDPERRILAPTLLLNVATDAAVMRHEIFGPILPVLDFTEMSTVTSWLQDNDKPLAMYVFGRDREAIENVLAATSSGGVSINGWALHFADSRLPFGGIGGSGMGRYHGVHGFRELSHARSVVSVGTAE